VAKGGPYSEGAVGGSGQFGTMRVEDDGRSPLRITVTGRRYDGTLVTRFTFAPQTSAPPSEDVAFATVHADGAAQESNRASGGLHDRAGVEGDVDDSKRSANVRGHVSRDAPSRSGTPPRER
jgi:hypothetical protein